VGRCDHFPGASSVVVAKVVGDEGAGPNEVVVLVQKQARPGKLSRAHLTKAEASGWSELSGPTLFDATRHLPFCALLSPQALGLGMGLFWAEAASTKHGQVNVSIIAANFLVPRTRADGFLLRGDVDNPGADGERGVFGPGINQSSSNKVLPSKGISALL